MGVKIVSAIRPTERAPWAFLLGVLVVVAGCGSKTKPAEKVETVPERLRAHVTHLATTIGVRDQSNVAAANAAARWVEGEFRKVSKDASVDGQARSEERRVGKEGRWGG